MSKPELSKKIQNRYTSSVRLNIICKKLQITLSYDFFLGNTLKKVIHVIFVKGFVWSHIIIIDPDPLKGEQQKEQIYELRSPERRGEEVIGFQISCLIQLIIQIQEVKIL